MKKTLLSILAGLAVIGSASAVPGPEERMELCKKHPEKYVWVEKTQACIPINPCESNNPDIFSAYCMLANDRPLYSTGEKLDYVIKYFTEHSLKDTVKETHFLDGDFVAVNTTGGYYFVARVINPTTPIGPNPIFQYITDAIDAVNMKSWHAGYNAESRKVEISGNNAEAFCEEVADLASLLADTVITASSDASKCILRW